MLRVKVAANVRILLRLDVVARDEMAFSTLELRRSQ